MTSPANSRYTLTEANGCKARPLVVKLRPKRSVARPILLSMSLIARVPLIGLTVGPASVTASTSVRDQKNPADGSMNQPS